MTLFVICNKSYTKSCILKKLNVCACVACVCVGVRVHACGGFLVVVGVQVCIPILISIPKRSIRHDVFSFRVVLR